MLIERIVELEKEMEDKNLPVKAKESVLKVFMEAYHHHKQAFGSFRHHAGQEYLTKMESRYNFMYSLARKEMEKYK